MESRTKTNIRVFFCIMISVIALMLVTANAEEASAALLKGVYAGSANPGVVYEYEGESAWAPISPTLGRAILSITEYDGTLYAGVQSASNRGQVYRYEGHGEWTLIGEMDSQVASLAVYNDRLYAGTVGGARGLYVYDEDSNAWTRLFSYVGAGIRTMKAWEQDNALYLGDYNSDRIFRYDGTTLVQVLARGRSCIWDFEAYNGKFYAGAYYGVIYDTSNGFNWGTMWIGGSNIWNLSQYMDKLYYGNGLGLWSYNGVNRVNEATIPRDHYYNEILSLESDGADLYIGVGGEAGYYRRSGIGKVYRYDGDQLEPISGQMGSAVQVLYITDKIIVELDIKPGSDPNSININGRGVIPVAILTTDEFDARDVNAGTVRFGPSGAYAEQYALEDVDDDGDIDLILHFRTRDAGIAPEDTQAVLTGETHEGQRIEGSDSVKVRENNANTPEKPVHVKTVRHNIGVSDCDVAAVSGDVIAISMDEREDDVDYNEDGDMRDRVLGYYNIRKKKLVNTGIEIGRSIAIDGDIIVFEFYNNGWRLGYYSISESRLYDTGVDDYYRFGRNYRSATRAVSDGRIVYSNSAREICIYDTRTRNSYCTGVTGYSPSIGGNIVAFEAGGNEVGYYDLQTGETYYTGIAGDSPVVDNGIIVFESSEGVGYYDISRGEYVETPLVDGYSASISEGVISAFVDERDWGVDLSGDGDTNDSYMVMAYDIKSGTVINTGVQGCCGTDISNGVIVFDTYEGETDIKTDLNGDGDMGDCVQQYVILKEVRAASRHWGR